MEKEILRQKFSAIHSQRMNKTKHTKRTKKPSLHREGA